MPIAEELAGKVMSWLRKHRLEIVDLAGLGLAALAADLSVTHVPFLAGACAAAAAAFVPQRRAASAASPFRTYVSGLPRRLALLVGIGAAWLYFWGLPASSLWVGPIWLGLAWASSWNWRPLAAWAWAALAWVSAHRSPRGERALRILLLAVTSLWLMRGFNAPFLQGGGDAAWYGAVMADTAAQVRAGVFPIWAGQSAFQFNGAISPVRIAPAFSYMGALLDTLTFHSLGPVTLLNLLLTSVALAAMASAYICLGALLPARRWLAAGLAVLFMACPGVLGIAYNGDLYMSWMTLPLIPIVFLGTVLSFRPGNERRALLMLAVSLGLCWWAHPPIALWATLLAALAQLARLLARRSAGVPWAALVFAALIFAALAAYPVGSVLLFPPEHGAHLSEVQLALPGVVVEFIRNAFPGALLPMSAVGRAPGDVQLGYALWALLVFCLCYRYRGAPLESRILLTEAAFLAVLLLPIPGISLLAWKAVPAFIRNPTGNWAAPRLYMPLAAATVFALAAASGTGAAARGRRAGLLAFLVAAGCAWSLIEASKFAGESRIVALDPVAMVDKLIPENLQLTRYSYGMFPRLPSTFTHGVTDPDLENHLLSRDGSSTIVENAAAALAASRPVSTAGFVKRHHGDADFIELDAPLRIEPGHAYLLQLVIERLDYAAGVLQIKGRDFFREYGLPEHGGPRAFGIGGEHLGVIPIWTTKGDAESLMIRFFPAAPVTLDQGLQFASEVRLLACDRNALPIRVESWIPYTAKVRSAEAALLETPRMYQSGYTAWVNGAPAQVSKSPDGFVCVAVPAGDSLVKLEYLPPAGLRLLFWTSFICAVVVLMVIIARLCQAISTSMRRES